MKIKTKPSQNSRTVSPQAKFAGVRKDFAAALVDREEEVDLALTALLCRQHCLFVGPPGTAKSQLVNGLQDWIEGARKFTVHCCKDTLRNMTFGPTKLSALKQDRSERALEGGAADCHLLVLEECFKAGPAVLDTFLLMMNERVYVEGLVRKVTPLLSIFGTSNEWSPEGCEAALSAFFDRFLFRKTVNPIRGKEGRKRLLAKAAANDDCKPTFASNIDLDEVKQAQKEAAVLPWSKDAKQALWTILEELGDPKDKDFKGVQPGDRRIYQSLGAARAFAYLGGDGEVTPEHLEVLQHVLWIDPLEQPKVVAKVVQKVANPVGMVVNSKWMEAEDVIAKATPAEVVSKLQLILRDLEKLRDDPRRDKVVGYVTDEIKRQHNRLLRVCDDCGKSYAMCKCGIKREE